MEESLDLGGEPNTYKGLLAANFFTIHPSMNPSIEVTQLLASYV
jgi:hypothetical protein